MTAVFAVDACRTPIGKIKGALAGVRPDHLTADVIKGLLGRNPWLDPAAIDDVYWGAANQAGEDNRNVARMGVLLAGLPVEVPGATVNRLCGSGMEAICAAARTIAAGDADICLAGGAESMTRAPFVLPRSADPFPRDAGLADTRLGWRLVSPLMREPVPAGQPGRDRGERGRALPRRPGPAGPVRADQPPAGGQRPAGRAARAGDHPGGCSRREGDAGRGHQARPDHGRAGRPSARLPRERNRHRRELLAAERRRGRPAADVRAGGDGGRGAAAGQVRRARARPGYTRTTWASARCPR